MVRRWVRWAGLAVMAGFLAGGLSPLRAASAMAMDTRKGLMGISVRGSEAGAVAEAKRIVERRNGKPNLVKSTSRKGWGAVAWDQRGNQIRHVGFAAAWASQSEARRRALVEYRKAGGTGNPNVQTWDDK